MPNTRQDYKIKKKLNSLYKHEQNLEVRGEKDWSKANWKIKSCMEKKTNRSKVKTKHILSKNCLFTIHMF